jgi:hypothetical protein
MLEYHVIGKVMEEKMQTIYYYFRYPQSEPIIRTITLPCDDISKHMEFFNDNIIISYRKVNIFKEYKECFIVKSEREFKDYDTLTYKGKDYKISYKYNEDEKQHELYIDCEIEIIKLEEDFIKKCDDNYKYLMEFRKVYTEKQKQEFEEKDKLKNESKSILNKLKRMFMRS